MSGDNELYARPCRTFLGEQWKSMPVPIGFAPYPTPPNAGVPTAETQDARLSTHRASNGGTRLKKARLPCSRTYGLPHINNGRTRAASI